MQSKARGIFFLSKNTSGMGAIHTGLSLFYIDTVFLLNANNTVHLLRVLVHNTYTFGFGNGILIIMRRKAQAAGGVHQRFLIMV